MKDPPLLPLSPFPKEEVSLVLFFLSVLGVVVAEVLGASCDFERLLALEGDGLLVCVCGEFVCGAGCGEFCGDPFCCCSCCFMRSRPLADKKSARLGLGWDSSLYLDIHCDPPCPPCPP